MLLCRLNGVIVVVIGGIISHKIYYNLLEISIKYLGV